MKILLNCINIFIMKYYEHITLLLKKIKIFCFSATNEDKTTLKYYFLPSIEKTKIQVLIKIKFWLATVWVKVMD